MERLKAIFRDSSLQMVSFTITEKGYALSNLKGEFFPVVQSDFEQGPAACGVGGRAGSPKRDSQGIDPLSGCGQSPP